MTNPLQAKQAITFDDVLLEPRYSEVIPSEVEVATQLTKRIQLQIPLLGAPMDTVTEHAMGISLAQQGWIGLSLIHISEPTRLLSISYAVLC